MGSLKEQFPVPKQLRTIPEWLAKFLDDFEEIVKPFADTNGRTLYLVHFGDKWQMCRLADDLPNEARNALEGMNLVKTFLHHIDDDGTLTGNLEWVIQCSYSLGRLVERIPSWQFVDLAAIGQSTRKAQSDRGKQKRIFKTDEEKQQAFEIIGRYFNPPTVPITEACKRAVPKVREEMQIEAGISTLRRLWNKMLESKPGKD